MKKTLRLLVTTSFVYMILGVASGLFYREFTKMNGFPEGTRGQLGLTHTHFLALGFFASLTFLVLEKLFRLSESRRLFGWFYALYNIGVLVTAGMLFVHGILQIQNVEVSGMIPGIAGLGHILLTAGLIVLWVLLNKAISRQRDEVPAVSAA